MVMQCLSYKVIEKNLEPEAYFASGFLLLLNYPSLDMDKQILPNSFLGGWWCKFF